LKKLRLTSCLAENTEVAGRAIARYLEERLSLQCDFLDGITWAEREKRLEEGDIHAGWVCGLLYTWKFDRPEPPVELLAAPVLREPRYQGQPVYFSDVIVHRQSPYRSFEELRGTACAYNEARSFSGYYVLRHHLAMRGETEGFFSRTLLTGTHLNSLKMVCRGQADAAAIDSSILEWEMKQDPWLGSHIRTVQILGPNPAPPWVISRAVPQDFRRELQETLLSMHDDPLGRELLAGSQVGRFAAVSDTDYDPIRVCVKIGNRIPL
jgi:phosphonate transport system substrate-binding protein